MKDLRTVAKEATSSRTSPYTEGREFMKISKLMAKFDDFVMIDGVDPFSKRDGTRKTVLCFERDGNSFYTVTGASSIVNVADEWLNLFDDDVEALNEQLQDDPIKVRIYSAPGNQGDFFTLEVLDD